MTRVLIVDDSDLLVKALCWQLESYDYDTTGCSRPDLLLNPASPLWTGVDVLLCDLMMAAADGFQVAEVARDAHPHIRRVCLTGLREPSFLQAATELFDVTVEKVADLTQILSAIGPADA